MASTSEADLGMLEEHGTIADLSPEKQQLFPGFEDVSTFSQHALGQLMRCTKAANGLPAYGDDYDFYSSYESFRDFSHEQSDRILININSLMAHKGGMAPLAGGSSAPELEDKMDTIIETNDGILEKVGLLLDEASGLIKPGQVTLPPGSRIRTPQNLMVASWNRQGDAPRAKSFRLMHAANIQRPQLKFKDKTDNTNTPFVPKIRVKPNALKPLASSKLSSPADAISSFIRRQRVGDDVTDDSCSHPYQYELDHLTPAESILLPVEEPSYAPLDSTPLTLVDSTEALTQLSAELDTLKEFAVDLEHHSYRSFQGITCLMQISTGRHDYIIDTLELWSELHVLNNSFTNPDIVKVFHGADMDIEWLQRDLGIYVVNMFDTGQAARILGKARFSLAHLLQVYCEVEADKQYQLADWRIRPLPVEMLRYGREDTHYLLYIYHVMKNELRERGNAQSNLLKQALQQSTQICLKRYHKPIFTDESYVRLLAKHKKKFSVKQKEAVRLLYGWRDHLARQEDESTGYVLPNHMLLHIAEILPREQHGILSCCQPIPPLVRQQLTELHHLIVAARGFSGENLTPVSGSQTHPEPAAGTTPKALSSLLYCPHDPTPQNESVRGVPSQEPSSIISHHSKLFADDGGVCGDTCPPLVKMAKPVIMAFTDDAGNQGKKAGCQQAARIRALFVNPFQMFLSKQPVQVAAEVLNADKIDLTPNTGTDAASMTSKTQTPNLPAALANVWLLKASTTTAKTTPVKPVIAAADVPVIDAPDKSQRQQKRKEPTDDADVPMTYRPPAKKEKKMTKPDAQNHPQIEPQTRPQIEPHPQNRPQIEPQTRPQIEPHPQARPQIEPQASSQIEPQLHLDVPAEPFRPFDYGAANKTATASGGFAMRRGRGGRGRGQRGRGLRHFDPYSQNSDRGRRDMQGKGRGRMPYSFTAKSVTYSQHQRGSGGKRWTNR